MTAREMWSTGTPDEPGRYLVAWKWHGIEPHYLYEVQRWDGSEWTTIPSHVPQPDHWRAFMSPYEQEREIEKEYQAR